jgi:hypothetical protein
MKAITIAPSRGEKQKRDNILKKTDSTRFQLVIQKENLFSK